jgi:hypothetical protein
MAKYSNGMRVGEIFDRETEKIGLPAARRRACNSSVTLIKDNEIKYTAVMNLFTGDVFVGSAKGIFHGNIKTYNPEKRVLINTPVNFDNSENMSTICYTLKGKYENNRMGTHLRFFPLHPISYKRPVGPMRFCYLVRFQDESEEDMKDLKVGVVAHNGEKIQESLPNIAIAHFSKGELEAYKLFCDPKYKEITADRDMTPNLLNSLYSDMPIEYRGIQSTFLNTHEYPSDYRDTTLIFSRDNGPAHAMALGMVDQKFAVKIV